MCYEVVKFIGFVIMFDECRVWNDFVEGNDGGVGKL